MEYEIKTLIIVAGAVILGALARIGKYLSSKTQVVVTATVILSSILISLFAGLIFGLITSVYTESLTWVIIASSLGAYMGDKGIETVWEKVLELISKK